MVRQKRKNIDDYNTYIVDVDGTLYFKKAMQFRMAILLGCYYLIHFWRVKELLLLKDYRVMRDKDEYSGKEDFESIIICNLSKKYGFDEKKTSLIINEWILEKPVKILFACRDKKLISFLNMQKKKGKRVYIYSDYPTEDKVRALGICFDEGYWPDKKRISLLKPSTQGINYILSENNVDKKDVLFIGDRYEKDGKCAEDAGVDYVILSSGRCKRNLQYNLFMAGKNNEKV